MTTKLTEEEADELAKRWAKLLDLADHEESIGRKGYAKQLRHEALSIEIDLVKSGFWKDGQRERKKA
jgi:hypothetical protein